MKNLNQIGIFLLLSLIFTACNSSKKEDHSQHENKKEDHSQHDKNKETTFYTCSMDPQVKEDKPGKCPICHMELTPIKQDDSEVNQISLSKQQIQLGNITTQVIGQTQNNLEQLITTIKKYNYDLVLAGHSHNGQIALPVYGAVFTPENAKEYYKPYYKIDNTLFYISSGVGTTKFDYRFLNKPSFNLYRILKK